MKRVSKAVVLSAAAGVAVVGGAGIASAGGHGATAHGAVKNSPGVLSGNLVQTPLDMPINVCGNTLEAVGLLSPAFGNHCVNR
ncbi:MULTISPECIES: chaplin [unclassified Streptomyces]|uniref:chaplin n=1 Tax=unclassified Streptomyces TaxID=2593676 RepID=UPI003808AE06